MGKVKSGDGIRVEIRTSQPVVEVVHHGGPLTVDELKEIVGWEEEPMKDGEVVGKGWGEAFKLKDAFGHKIRLKQAKANRPFRPALAKQYALEMLRGKWEFNGESFVFDTNEMQQDGQHRMVGAILAEQMRVKTPDKWKHYGIKGPITLEGLLVRGISPKAEVVDTLGTGLKRSLGDVIYRDRFFNDVRKGLPDKMQIKLSNVLAVATRMVWLRVVGKSVSDAPHFPHSEAMDFLRHHRRIAECVLAMWDEEVGDGDDTNRISQFVSVGYAAGLMYLMAVSKTNPDKFLDEGAKVLDFKNLNKAQKFWHEFANGDELEEDSPVYVLREILGEMEAGSAMGREEIIRTVVKAWNLWIEDKPATEKDVRVEKVKNEERGVMVMAENPRIGGIDVEWETDQIVEEAEEAVELNKTIIDPETGDEVVVRKTKKELTAERKALTEAKEGKGKKKGKMKKHPTGWSIEDTCWVKEDESTPAYFGTIIELTEEAASVRAKDDGEEYIVAIKCLMSENPDEAGDEE